MAAGAENHFDIVIVGGGPAGLAAGAQAAKQGVRHVVLERGELANTIHSYQKGKFVMAEPLDLVVREQLLPLKFEEGTREQILEGWATGSEEIGTNLRIGPGAEVTKLEGAKGDFKVHLKDGSLLTAENLILAIGLQGNLREFGVPGDQNPHVTYQLADPGEHIDKYVALVGAGDAGIENAMALSANNDVTVVNRRDEFPRAKPRNRQTIESAIKAGDVQHATNATIKEIHEDHVVLDTPSGDEKLKADMVLGRLGAIPPRKFLEDLGVEFPSDDPPAVPEVSEKFESNVPGVYLVGAIAGYPLIKHCMNQGYEAVEHILGNHVVPADEDKLAEKFAKIDGTVSEILARIQATIPLFKGITRIQLREFLGDSTVHVFAKGETIYLRNDFSDSIYSILEGSAVAVVPADEADVDSSASGPVPELRFPIPTGNFFGEMSLISGRRRSATMEAADHCVCIETPRLSMIRLMSSVRDVKRVIDEVFIVRKLQTDLAPGVPLPELEELAHSAVIETYKQGDLLFEDEDESNGLHLIRRGSVTVSKVKGGTEKILAYLPAGNIVGEMALFHPEGTRNARVRATILTETIRIPPEAIGPFLESHEELRRELKTKEAERLVQNAMASSDKRASGLVEFLMGAGAGEATDILLIDEALCVRCDNCEKACADTHGGVSRLDREAGPTFATVHIPTSCRHCENPKCMTDCPPDALRRKPSGEVYILDNCIGCGNCSSFCPYGVIQMAAVDEKYMAEQKAIREGRAKPSTGSVGKIPGTLWNLLFGGKRGADKADKKMAVKCDLCTNLPAKRGQHRAACVASCPTGAILRVSPKDYVDSVMAAED